MVETRSSSGEHGPTQSQSAAEVSVYLKTIRELKATARKHARQEPTFKGRSKFRRELKNQLINFYVTDVISPTEQKGQTPSASKESGTAQDAAHTIYENIAPKLEQIETTTREHASELGVIKRGVITAETIWRINRSQQISEQLLERAGYSHTDKKFIRGKLAKSGVADAITTGAAVGVVSLGTAAEVLSHTVPQVTRGDLIASEVGLYATTAVVAWTNKKLLDSAAVKTTANLLATTAYYFSPKLLSERWKTAMEWVGVSVGTAIPVVLGDIAGWTAIRSMVGAQGTFGRTLASIGIETATALGNMGWLAYRNRQEKKSEFLL